MLTEPAAVFEPTFPGLFAADPPEDVIAVLDAVAADVGSRACASRLPQWPMLT
jgi:hypothetical protein